MAQQPPPPLQQPLQIPNVIVPPPPPPPPYDPPPIYPPPPPPQPGWLFTFPKRPSFRVTSEFDSDSSLFFHKISCKLFESVAKLKFCFQNDNKGQLSQPQVSFTSKHLSIHYDLEEQSTFLNSSFDVGPRLHFRAAHDVKVALFFFLFMLSSVWILEISYVQRVIACF